MVGFQGGLSNIMPRKPIRDSRKRVRVFGKFKKVIHKRNWVLKEFSSDGGSAFEMFEQYHALKTGSGHKKEILSL